MSATLRAGAVLSLDSMIAAVIEAAARDLGAEAIAVCCVDLGDEDGRRFALALHEASPAPLDPASFTAAGAAPWWCQAAPLAKLARAAAAVLGADMGAAVEATHAAHAVPVVIIAGGVAMVAAFERPRGAS